MAATTTVPTHVLRVLVIGPSGSGKSSVITSFTRLLRATDVNLPSIGHSNQRGTASAGFHIVLDILFVDTPGFCDNAGLDDKFNRELQQNREFGRFDIVLYCYRARSNPITSSIRYGDMFGINTPVTLCICDYPDAAERVLSLQAATAHVQAQGMVVRNHFFIPPVGLIDATPDMRNLYNYIRTFNNTPAPARVNFTAGPLTTTARDIVLNIRARNAQTSARDNIDRELAAATPCNEKIACSVGMGNGEAKSGQWRPPSGRSIVKAWTVDLSVNDGDHNGWARISHTPEQCNWSARMPEKRGGVLGIGKEGQWYDADFWVTHQGPISSLTTRRNEITTALAIAEARLNDFRTRHTELYNDINSHWAYYNSKVPQP